MIFKTFLEILEIHLTLEKLKNKKKYFKRIYNFKLYQVKSQKVQQKKTKTK